METNAPEWWIIAIGLVGAALSGAVFPSFSIFYGYVLDILARPPDQIFPDIHPWAALFIVIGISSFFSIFIKV